MNDVMHKKSCSICENEEPNCSKSEAGGRRSKGSAPYETNPFFFVVKNHMDVMDRVTTSPTVNNMMWERGESGSVVVGDGWVQWVGGGGVEEMEGRYSYILFDGCVWE